MIEQLRPVRIGLFFAVLTILLGYSLGMIFGGFEDSYKSYAKNTLAENQVAFTAKATDTMDADTATKAKMAGAMTAFKKYSKRAHLHAGAIGTGTLAMIIVLSFFGKNILFFSEKITCLIKLVFSLGFGVGGFFYGSYWTLVAIGCLSNPDKYAVKDGGLAVLAFIGAGPVYLCTLGLAAILFVSIFYKPKS